MIQLPIVMVTIALSVISSCPTVNAFNCSSSLQPDKYFVYNETSKICYQTTDSSNDSKKFCTELECYTSSQTAQELCTSDKVVGLCKARIPSFYYNSTYHECLKFVYGGCGGNGNRFPTAEMCTGFCEGV